ncbi:MAG: hypothetical protein SX243_24545 [Acidobacteriota bacterium]|nr:hypothetical protein [Acidobacteriota bacterium]
MRRSEKCGRIWNGGRGRRLGLAVLVLGALGWGTTQAVLAGKENGESTLHMELPEYLAATASYKIPAPTALPAVETDLLEARAEVAAKYAPDPAATQLAARLELLRSILDVHRDAMLAEASIIGVGITPIAAGGDWEMVVMVPEGTSPAVASAALVRLGVLQDLGDFNHRFEISSPPIFTADERPGSTGVWNGEDTGPMHTQCDVGTMGWLVQSKLQDEQKRNGDRTSRQSVGYLTALHTTAAGFSHNWERFDVLPRNIQTKQPFFSGCNFFSTTGRVLRAGPAAVPEPKDITQDITFVSFDSEAACNQASTDTEVLEGLPTCDDSNASDEQWLMMPPETSEVSGLLTTPVFTCGVVSGSMNSGFVEGLSFSVQFGVSDWDGNFLFNIMIEDLWRIVSPGSEFNQPGDSGGPVWFRDPDAFGGEGAFRPLGTNVGKGTGATEGRFFVASLPENLNAFNVDLILNNPRDPESEDCSCECTCESLTGGLNNEDGRLLLETALAAGPEAMKRLTSLAVTHETELRTLAGSSQAATYDALFASKIAPFIRTGFSQGAPTLDADAVNAAREILAWIYHSTTTPDLKAEASRLYRFVSVHAEGRTVGDLLRDYVRYGQAGEKASGGSGPREVARGR